jgi:hypothetical protein
MEIRPGLNSSSLQVALSSLPAMARAWSAGETIEALVVRVDPARGTVLLQLAEGEVEAHSELPLQPGMRLQLTAETGDGSRILLRLRNDPAGETRLAALRQALPRELPLAPLFEAVEQILRSPGPLPEPVRRQAEALAQARPTPERLATPAGLRSALRDSGMVLESRLADPDAPAPAADLKGRLLALIAALTAAPKPAAAQAPEPATAPSLPVPQEATVPPEQPPRPTAGEPREKSSSAPVPGATDEILATLSRHAEGALARIQFHQLQALPDTQPAPQWLFELPVQTPRGNETLLLRFERDEGHENGAGKTAPGWRVTLDLTSPEHGALRAVVGWRGGELSTRFFAEREATARTLRDHFHHLSRRLDAAGITVGTIEAHTGIPAAAPRPTAPLLSERA